jgi:Iron-sulfur cluster-binding domain
LPNSRKLYDPAANRGSVIEHEPLVRGAEGTCVQLTYSQLKNAWSEAVLWYSPNQSLAVAATRPLQETVTVPSRVTVMGVTWIDGPGNGVGDRGDSSETVSSELERFWRPYADSVMKQYVIRRKEIDRDTDAYLNVQRASNEYPRCTLQFKDLCVMWDGNVPLCQYSAMQTGAEPGLLLGNLNTTTILHLWNAPLMKQYREAHRTRQTGKMPICTGCVAV